MNALLKNKKIWIGDNPALSEEIQKALFKLGYIWGSQEKTILHTDKPVLFTFDDGFICFDDDYESFISSPFEAISCERVLELGHKYHVERKDVHNTKVWIGHHSILSNQVQDVLFSMGFTYPPGEFGREYENALGLIIGERFITYCKTWTDYNDSHNEAVTIDHVLSFTQINSGKVKVRINDEYKWISNELAIELGIKKL